MIRLLIFIGLSLLSEGLLSQESLVPHREVIKLMGTRFEITAMADTKENAQEAVHKGIAEIKRIESLISSWKSDSQTSQINAMAGKKPVVVDRELFDLIERSFKVSEVTQGAFDISFASITHSYTFDRAEYDLPDDEQLTQSVQNIDWQSIILNRSESSVFLAKEGMRIGFGGIGKGYAANAAKRIMSSLPTVKGGVVNASGDLMIWGQNGKEEGWPIQIADPQDINKSLAWFTVQEGSVVTSGNYEQYFTNEGKRYAHIINPHTGLPTTDIKSVTIVCPDAELGDALATSVFVLGEVDGIALIDRLKNVEALLINDNDEIITSNKLQLNYQ